MHELNKKVLILGLNNSGKTSLVFSLMGKNLMSLHDELNPTKGLDRKSLKINGDSYIVLDFGGQEIYRKNHLDNFVNYLSGTDKIIFLIDIQDNESYPVALNYLKEIVKIINNNSIDLKFSILLHKYDPKIEKNMQSKGEKVNFKNDIKELISRIKEIFIPNLEFEIKKSTIFTVFRNSTIY